MTDIRYLYETHLHTSPGSACSKTAGREYIRMYKDNGYQGIFVTDHFYRGNCGIDRGLPWPDFVEQFCAGFESAREEGARVGLDVFFGWEESYGDEYLIYGLDKSFLLAHPDMYTWTRKQQYDAVRAAGGCVVQAHPFRERSYISAIRLSTGCVDGVEVGNSGNKQEADALAYRYAQRLGLPMTAGGDTHSAGTPQYGVWLETKLQSGKDYAERILAGERIVPRVPAGRFDNPDFGTITLPLEIRDEEDRVTGQSLEDWWAGKE